MEGQLAVPLIALSLLLLFSVMASKFSDKIGVPVILVFLVIGMLAGSDGIGRIYFDNATLAQEIGIIALAMILFSGGLDTNWQKIRTVIREGLLISTFGVLITALIVGVVIHFVLGFSWTEGFLVGAIVSSTDAAVVFALLKSKGIQLKGKLVPLLEFESGTNDPMAVFLTVGLLELITHPNTSPLQLVPLFLIQMVVGALMGLGVGKLGLYLINRLRLGYEGLYPVLSIALVLFAFGITDLLRGSGFLAVYLAGVTIGQAEFLHKRSMIRFFDGFAWLMQVFMFLTLGLLVFPSRLVPVILPAMLVAIVLMLVARPASIFISLLPARFSVREKLFVSWVGLRGAVPIVLATFPYQAGLKNADLIFNVVFFVVLTSVLFQGTSLTQVARWLKVEDTQVAPEEHPVELNPLDGIKGEMKEIVVLPTSPAIGKAIFQLGLHPDFLIILIGRGAESFIPNGGSVILAGDKLVFLSTDEAHLVSVGKIQPATPEEFS